MSTGAKPLTLRATLAVIAKQMNEDLDAGIAAAAQCKIGVAQAKLASAADHFHDGRQLAARAGVKTSPELNMLAAIYPQSVSIRYKLSHCRASTEAVEVPSESKGVSWGDEVRSACLRIAASGDAVELQQGIALMLKAAEANKAVIDADLAGHVAYAVISVGRRLLDHPERSLALSQEEQKAIRQNQNASIDQLTRRYQAAMAGSVEDRLIFDSLIQRAMRNDWIDHLSAIDDPG